MKKLLSIIMLLSLAVSLCAMEGQWNGEKEETEQSENSTIMVEVTWDFLKELPSDVVLSIISYLPLKERLHVLAGLLFEINRDKDHLLFDRAEHIKSLLKKEGWGIKISHLIRKAEQLSESDISAIKELIQNGANIDAQDRSGNTPLRYVTYLYVSIRTPYLPQIAHVLLDAGADVNIKDNEGNTPLIFAAATLASNALNTESKLLIEALIKKGADPTIAINAPLYVLNGKTPRQRLQHSTAYRWSTTKLEPVLETIKHLENAEEAWEQKTANKEEQ